MKFTTIPKSSLGSNKKLKSAGMILVDKIYKNKEPVKGLSISSLVSYSLATETKLPEYVKLEIKNEYELSKTDLEMLIMYSECLKDRLPSFIEKEILEKTGLRELYLKALKSLKS